MPRLVPYTHHPRQTVKPTVDLDLDAAFGLYDRQARFANNDAFYSLFLAGVSAGKTHALTAFVLIRALKNPGCVGAMFGRTMKDHERVLIPRLLGRLAEIKDACGVNLLADYSKGESKITLINGSEIWCLPFNQVDKLRGLEIAFAGVDESDWSTTNFEDIWTVLVGRVRGKDKQGRDAPVPGIAFCTSPNGTITARKFIDARRKYDDAKAKGDAEGVKLWGQYYVVHATAFHNPHTPQSYIEGLKSISAKRYRQEVLGIPAASSNSVFSLQAEHFTPWDWRQHPECLRVYGTDWGNGATGNASVMCQVGPAGVWVVADELNDDCPRGQYMDKLEKWAKSHGQADPLYWGVDRAIPVENNLLKGKFRHTRVSWLRGTEEQSITRGVEMMRDMLEPFEGPPRLLFSTSLTQLHDGTTAPIIPAMRGLAYFLDADGNATPRIRYNTPFSHACDALRYAQQAGAYDPQLHGGKRPWREAA